MNELDTNSNEVNLFVTNGNRTRLVKPFEIVYIKADDNYSVIKLSDTKSYIICIHLKILEGQLEQYGFFRCHRSYLVKLNEIKEIIRDNSASVVMTNGDIIPVSRRKIQQLVWSLRINQNSTVYPLKHTVP